MTLRLKLHCGEEIEYDTYLDLFRALSALPGIQEGE